MPFNTRITSGDPLDEVQTLIDQAQSHHLASKESAKNAVAHAYLYSRLISASEELRAWENRRIEELNAEIKAYNEALSKDRKRAIDYTTGRLPKDDLIYLAKTAQERQEATKEDTRLKDLARRSDKEWTALRKVKIDQREGASSFTRCAKFVFRLDRATDASTISRYAYVMEWAHGRIGQQPIDSPAPIVQAINEAGGFEACLEAQRAKKSDRPPKAANTNVDAKVEAIRKGVDAEPAKVTASVTLDTAEGLVVVVGRYSKGSLDILRTLNMSDDEMDKLLLRYATDAANT